MWCPTTDISRAAIWFAGMTGTWEIDVIQLRLNVVILRVCWEKLLVLYSEHEEWYFASSTHTCLRSELWEGQYHSEDMIMCCSIEFMVNSYNFGGPGLAWLMYVLKGPQLVSHGQSVTLHLIPPQRANWILDHACQASKHYSKVHL